MSVIFASKFVNILKTFNEAELKSFDTWLRSPWCNSNKNLVKLLAELRKYYPAFHYKKLSKEQLFQKILPKGKFSDRRMNNLLSEAYLAAERFMIFQHLAQNENLQKDILSQEWQNRDREKWFFKTTRKKIAQLEEKPIKAWEDHLEMLQLQRRIYHHPNQKIRMQTGAATLQSMDEQLELTYLLEKAAIINEKMARQRILRDENYELEADLVRWKAASQAQPHPALDFYQMRFDYTDDNRLSHYWKLRNLFFERYEELSETQQKLHLTALLNDTTWLAKAKLLENIEVLPLYKLGLENELVLYKERISHATFVTIVGASNIKSDFDFTYKFIDKYILRLDVKYRLDCINWARSHTAYWEKKYTACIDLLISYTFQHYYFKLAGRLLMTQAYFDLYLKDDSYESFLFNYFDAFEKWLLREKVWSKANKVSFLRFVQKCRALAKHHNKPDFQLSKVESLFEDVQSIQALDWLQRKQQEIICLRNRY
ncbi:MAG: hypothetical protein AAF849_21460 [Bacteroidota bacterium]